jgi:hypothetical protein
VRGPGWFKQQVIKLSAFNIVKTEWVLMLDADVIVCRPVTLHDLFIDGRAVVPLEPAWAHSTWWHGSAKLLGIASPFSDDDVVMGVTPELLHAPTLRKLAMKLSNIAHGEQWQSFLMREENTALNWTEYSLYWTYVVANRLDLYSTRPISMYGDSIWSTDDWVRFSDGGLSEAIDRSGQLFLVLQSRLGLNISEVLPPLSSRLRGRPVSQIEIEMLKARETAAALLARVNRRLNRIT